MFISFTASSFALNTASLVSGAIVLKWIPPIEMGIWQVLVLVQSFIAVIRIGIPNGLNRELPFLLGQGDQEHAYRAVEVAQWYTLVCAGIGVFAFVGAIPVLRPSGIEWQLGLVTSCLIVATNFYLTYVFGTFRSSSDFASLTRLQFLQSAIVLAAPVFAYFGGFVGYCIHTGLVAIVMTVCAYLLRPIKVKSRFDAQIFWRLFRTGFPLFVTNYALVLAMSFDRVILLNYGLEYVGLYAPVSAVLSAMMILPGSIAAYVYPRMAFQFGKTQERKSLWFKLLRAYAVSFVVGLPMVLAGFIALPALVQALLPAYVAAIPAMNLALFNGLLMSTNIGITLFGSVKAWKPLFAYCGVFLSLKWIFPSVLAQGKDVLIGVAAGSLLASAVSAGVMVWMTYWVSRREVSIRPERIITDEHALGS